MGMLGGITYTGDYPVRPTDDAISGKAILMESVFPTGGAIFGTPVPKDVYKRQAFSIIRFLVSPLSFCMSNSCSRCLPLSYSTYL